MPSIVESIIFYFFAALMVLSAVRVVSARNMVHSVLFLILAFVNAAGLFVLQGAEFLGMILVVVYVGAVAVLFLFVVMMLDINRREARRRLRGHGFAALVLAGIVLFEFLVIAFQWQGQDKSVSVPLERTPLEAPLGEGARHGGSSGQGSAERIGEVLYTDYFYIFQGAGLVLLAAMIGAIVLTLRHRPDARRQSVGDQLGRQAADTVRLVDLESGSGAVMARMDEFSARASAGAATKTPKTDQ